MKSKNQQLSLITPKELTKITIKEKGKTKTFIGILIKGKDLRGDVLIILDELINKNKLRSYIG